MKPRIALLVWLGMFIAIAVGSLLPAQDLPTPAFDGIDKLEHLVGYAALSAYAALLFPTRGARLRALVAVIAFGVAIEVAQATFTTTRQADVVDAMANAIGALFGQSLALTRWSGRLHARG